MLLAATEEAATPDFFTELITSIKQGGINFLYGILVLILGLLVCRIIKVVLRKIFKKSKKDEALTSFVVSFLDVILKIIIMIAALATMGVNTASLITVIGTCGLAIGLALKDSLGNLASGMIIIFNKPFKKNDFIEVGGVSGQVSAINLFNTTLLTTDNKKVIIPNSTAVNNPIVNADGSATRRVDIVFETQKGIDIEIPKKIVTMLVKNEDRVFSDPAFSVRLSGQTVNSLQFTLKAWVLTKDYWDVFYDLTEQIYEELLKVNIATPSAQVDVSMGNEAKTNIVIPEELEKDIEKADKHMKKTSEERKYKGQGETDVIEVAIDKLTHIPTTNGKKKKGKKQPKEEVKVDSTVQESKVEEPVQTENSDGTK